MKPVCLIVQMVYDLDVRVRRKAEALVAAGYPVDVLALRPASGEARYTLNGVNVQTVSLGKKRGSLARYLFEYAMFFWWACFRVTWQMRQRKYAVIDVNTLPDFLVFATCLAKWMGARVILDMHEITPEFYMSKYGIKEDSWTIRTLTYLEKISMNFADCVLTINQPIEDLLVKRGLSRAKSAIVMNAADESQFAASANRSTASPNRSPAADLRGRASFVMIYHGTLTPIYGLDIAVEALALAQKEMSGAELWILGSGTEKQRLADLAQARGVASQVRIVGQVPSTDIPAWLNQSDVGILPIRGDVFLNLAFPNKLPELIISGKAVIISRLKAIQHYFTEDALAYFEPNDAADLAREMIRMYGNPQLRSRLALTAREEYQPIRWSVMKDRYLSLMGQLAGIPYETPVPSTQSKAACTP